MTPTGKVYLNGREDSILKYKKLVGFVPQEDTMLRELSVEEILWHSARTRLPSTMSTAEVHRSARDYENLGPSPILTQKRLRGCSNSSANSNFFRVRIWDWERDYPFRNYVT